jgi:uncharacterized protein
MKILTVSDVELSYIYSPSLKDNFGDSDFTISCGDLPYYYLEYIISSLNKPLYYVRGNHASKIEFGSNSERHYPWGGIDIHQRLLKTEEGILLGGMEGSLRYNTGPHQYQQSEMWLMIFAMLPRLLYNRLRYGRYLDIFVTHAPPWGVHDKEDRPHQGFKAYRWFIDVFRPAILLHGHIHIYRQDTITDTLVNQTRVINSYGRRLLQIEKRTQGIEIINVK